MKVPVHGFATMAPEVYELDFARLEEVSKVKFKRAHRKKILELLNRYLADAAIAAAAPGVPQVRNSLEKTEELSRELATSISSNSEISQAAVCLAFPFHRANPAAFVRVLRELAMSCRAWALDHVRDGDQGDSEKGGRPADDSLRPFLNEIGKVFDASGGGVVGAHWDAENEQWSGRLVELACELLEQAKKRGAPGYRRNTIAQVIKKLRGGKGNNYVRKQASHG